MTSPSANVAVAPRAMTATVASPPVRTVSPTSADAAANTAAPIRAPAIAPASAPRKLACFIGSPSRAAAGPGLPCGGETRTACCAPTRAIRVTISSPNDMVFLLSGHQAA
ncbi:MULTISPECIES: hypothetical protein [unclassified Photorhabdus]|uniref:hypothetical protein n=1 Tax=unclassified Photorhabdus TaxID=2620880 RepID=UPI001EFC2FA6|nr:MULTISPECIES: hypothetical protein [unclassified Photorhabdus]